MPILKGMVILLRALKSNTPAHDESMCNGILLEVSLSEDPARSVKWYI